MTVLLLLLLCSAVLAQDCFKFGTDCFTCKANNCGWSVQMSMSRACHKSLLFFQKVSDRLGQRHQRGLSTRRQTCRLCRRSDKHVAQLPLESTVSPSWHDRGRCDAGHRRCNDACTRSCVWRFWPITGWLACAWCRIARTGWRRVDDECDCCSCCQVRSDVSQVRKVRARLGGDD